MKMRTFILIFLVLSVTEGLAQSPARTLRKAYHEESEIKLRTFFQMWANETPPVSKEEISKMNDTTRNAYLSFVAFYQPLNLEGFGGSEWGNEVYQNVAFFLVQNQVKVGFADKVGYGQGERDSIRDALLSEYCQGDSATIQLYLSRDTKDWPEILRDAYARKVRIPEPEDVKYQTLRDFRPPVNSGDIIPLYLNNKYEGILNRFLGDKHKPLGYGNIMNPARAYGTSEDKKRFVEKYIKIFYGHWGGYWQLTTYPSASSITFDREMLTARISFRMIYEGGYAILENHGDHWDMIYATLTWIE